MILWLQIHVTKIVKIPIFVAFSNAMNPREIIPVPSLRRDAVPGHHARSRSIDPGLRWSGKTWIISRPDYVGLKGLIRVLWPNCTFRWCAGLRPQAVKPEPFHLTFWLVWSSPIQNQSQDRSFQDTYFHPRQVQDLQSSSISSAVQLYRFTKIWIVRSRILGPS